MISQKNQDKCFIQTSISVLKKNILLKIYFHLKSMTRIMLEPLHQIPFYMFIKMLYEIIQKLPLEYTPKKVHFFV
jgi:hypothetical protein